MARYKFVTTEFIARLAIQATVGVTVTVRTVTGSVQVNSICW